MKKQPVTPKQPELGPLVTELRGLIHSARRTAASTVNTLQVLTNFEIGRRIVQKTSAQSVAGEISQKPSGQLNDTQISQTASAKLSSQKGPTLSDQFRRIHQTRYGRVYQFYLPSKELLRQKLMDWVREQEIAVVDWNR